MPFEKVNVIVELGKGGTWIWALRETYIAFEITTAETLEGSSLLYAETE